LLKTLGFLALAATPVVAGTAPAPKGPTPVEPAVNDDLGVNIGLGYHTNYIWRGLNFGQNWVNGYLNGAIPLVGGAGEDGAGTRLAWDVDYGSLASDQDHFAPSAIGGVASQDFSFQRLQLGAALQHDVGPVTLSAGYRYYHNMGTLNNGGVLGNGGIGMEHGSEFSVGLATALGPINVATSANYDISTDGWYFDFDANTNIAVTDAISIVPFFNVGYGKNNTWQQNPTNFGGLLNGSTQDDVTGWTAISTGFRFPIKLNSRATLTPYIAGNLPLGATANIAGSARNNGGGAAGLPDTPFKSVLTGGVSLNVRF